MELAYIDYEIPAGVRGDFAFCFSGDSMAPWIPDGGVVLAEQAAALAPGEVGLFRVEGEMLCRQYCEDCFGNIYLFALNRARRDQDRTIPAGSGCTVYCCGRVLLDQIPPLPRL